MDRMTFHKGLVAATTLVLVLGLLAGVSTPSDDRQLVGEASAQTVLYTNDFEDGSFSDWSGGTVVNESYQDSKSYKPNDGERTLDTVTIDSSQSYNITMRFKFKKDWQHAIRFNDFAQFQQENLEGCDDSGGFGCPQTWWVGTPTTGFYGKESNNATQDYVSAKPGTWQEMKIHISNGYAYLRTWDAGTTEPDNWDLVLGMADGSGKISLYGNGFEGGAFLVDQMTVVETSPSVTPPGTANVGVESNHPGALQRNRTIESTYTFSAAWQGVYGTESISTASGTVSGVFYLDDAGTTSPANKIGVKNRSSGEAVYLEGQNGVYELTYQASDTAADEVLGQIDMPRNRWVNYKIRFGNGKAKAKIWNTTEDEPDVFQATGDINTFTGRMWADGSPGNGGVISVDGATVSEITPTPGKGDTRLDLDVPALLEPNTTADYHVYFIEEPGDSSVSETTKTEVTSSSNVTSGNVSALSVDEAKEILVATNEENVSVEVTLTANYTHNGTTYETSDNVTVASVELKNIDILPGAYRISGSFGPGPNGATDPVLAILVATLVGIVGGRLSTAFGGLSLMSMAVIVAWFGGFLSTGVMLVGVLMATFVGLNLAGNIDYAFQAR